MARSPWECFDWTCFSPGRLTLNLSMITLLVVALVDEPPVTLHPYSIICPDLRWSLEAFGLELQDFFARSHYFKRSLYQIFWGGSPERSRGGSAGPRWSQTANPGRRELRTRLVRERREGRRRRRLAVRRHVAGEQAGLCPRRILEHLKQHES